MKLKDLKRNKLVKLLLLLDVAWQIEKLKDNYKLWKMKRNRKQKI